MLVTLTSFGLVVIMQYEEITDTEWLSALRRSSGMGDYPVLFLPVGFFTVYFFFVILRV